MEIRLYSEEDSIASSGGHERNQVVVDAVGTGTAVPCVVGFRLDHRVAKSRNLSTIDGEHVMDEVELYGTIGGISEVHLLDNPLGRLQPKIAPKEVIRRAEFASKWATSAEFQRQGWTTSFFPGIEMKGGNGKSIQIDGDRSVRITHHAIAATIGDARN